MSPAQVRTLWLAYVPVAIVAVWLIAYDGWTYRRDGNESTISFVTAIVGREWPIFAFALGFVVSLLAVHFFLPVETPTQRRDLPALFAFAVGSIMGGLAAYLFWRQGRGKTSAGPDDPTPSGPYA